MLMSYETALSPHPLELDPPIIGSAPEVVALRQLIRRVAPASASVMIIGESGSGKELVARNLHSCSERRNGPFVAINCAALNPGVLESELFGHGRGSFTGAVQAHAGLFEQAHGGTLFLDEIGEVPPALQAKLLRVLQDGEVRRMGATVTRPVDVRVVSATNIDVRRALARKSFRADLYYRLNVVEVHVPPLRRRSGDVLHLLDFFFRARGLRTPDISPAARRILLGHDWPGNVRELENEVERMVALNAHAGGITGESLCERLRYPTQSECLDDVTLYEAPLREAVDYLEENRLRRTLAQTNWNKSQSARELGLSRQGLLKKIKRYNIAPSCEDDDD
jgi:transcriptional regulator with PAS, ATPase and Fis domain